MDEKDTRAAKGSDLKDTVDLDPTAKGADLMDTVDLDPTAKGADLMDTVDLEPTAKGPRKVVSGVARTDPGETVPPARERYSRATWLTFLLVVIILVVAGVIAFLTINR